MTREDVEHLIARLRTEASDHYRGFPGARRNVAALLDEAACALLAERDAAFAAGQESMRERAADATLHLCRMKGMGDLLRDRADAIRGLPIKDHLE